MTTRPWIVARESSLVKLPTALGRVDVDDVASCIRNQPRGLTALHASRFTICSLIMAFILAFNINVPSYASSSNLAERVIEHRLGNGLTVLMVERHQTPIVSINITFAVGGINEQVGQTGIAHLYEHMAFKGTRKIGTTNYEKEKLILDELALVGTELDQRQREFDANTARATDEARGYRVTSKRFTDLQAEAAEYVVGNEMALLYQRHGGVGLNASTGKDLTRYMISFLQSIVFVGSNRIGSNGSSCLA